jgi:hypothetical protein
MWPDGPSAVAGWHAWSDPVLPNLEWLGAVANFRNFDGRTRPVERNGSTQAAAKRKLKEALRDRATPSGGDGLAPDSRFRKAADLWLAEFEVAVNAGDRSATSKETYEQLLNTLILPAIGELRLRELTVPRLSALCRTVQGKLSVSTARTVADGVVRCVWPRGSARGVAFEPGPGCTSAGSQGAVSRARSG